MGLKSAVKGLNSVTWLMKSAAFNTGLMKTAYYEHNARYIQCYDNQVTGVQRGLLFRFQKVEGKFRTVNFKLVVPCIVIQCE